ncbi:AAA family ATPase [Vagococcus coleopterorum]|uniref:AAA family ATPase n=1 Tax=Vagococcus coleopterorum TaxID=2714946 RepID=A0A6G8ALD6_9ENTE|nr:UvrD-helicase domain-containing protein [Vagococcus coleopterorum]QIL45772.1 AAA family ATPase [Vagococcus coleopterorum]
MSEKQEWQMEQDHLSMVYDKLLEMERRVYNDSEEADEDSRLFLRNLSEDVRMNGASAADSFESLIQVEQKNQELAQLNYKREWLEKQKNVIKQLLDGPYFAKLDVKYPEETEADQFYIGVAGFSDENHEQYVYDWRSPIANLYYENSLGETSYDAPMGKVAVDLQKRRQLKLTKNKLLDFFDTSTAIEDPMLLEVLNEESSVKLQDITSTIQKEQNAIIRDTKSDVLIVEGIAGSGKTSTVLQRIAFLLYRYKDDLQPEQVLLLSPNPMFSRYIEEVLPSLGEKNPRQMTYRDLMRTRGRDTKIEELDAQLENVSVLNSLDNMFAIEEYVSELDVHLIDFKDIKLEAEMIISAKWMRQTVESLPQDIELYRKLAFLQEKMQEALAKFIKTEAKKPKWRNELENLSNEEYNHLFAKIKKGTEDEQIEKVVLKVVQHHYNPVRQYIANYSWLDMESHYLLATGLPLQTPMTLDQATEFAYLNHLVIRNHAQQKTKFVILDEVQDYTEAQLYFLAKVYGDANFTLVGDGYQAIFAQGTTFTRVEELFQGPNRQVTSVKLLKSYRSSGPISHFMKHLLGGDQSGVEVIDRPGKDPELTALATQEEYVSYLQERLTQLQEGYRQVILTKDSQEARELYKVLGEPQQVSLIADSSKLDLSHQQFVMPVHLAKGLEFDSVIVHNVSQKRFKTQHDLNLLYTASSRAMHELYLPYIENVSEFIEK